MHAASLMKLKKNKRATGIKEGVYMLPSSLSQGLKLARLLKQTIVLINLICQTTTSNLPLDTSHKHVCDMS